MKKTHCVSPTDILESLIVAVFTVDEACRITSFNKSAEQLLGLSRDLVVGRYCVDVFHSSLCGSNCPVLKSLTLGKPGQTVTGEITGRHSQLIEIRMTGTVLRNAQAEIIGGVGVLQQCHVPVRDDASMQHAVEVCEMQSLLAALRRNNNNRAAAARDLGIHKSTFFRKIKKMGIELPHVDGRFGSSSH